MNILLVYYFMTIKDPVYGWVVNHEGIGILGK